MLTYPITMGSVPCTQQWWRGEDYGSGEKAAKWVAEWIKKELCTWWQMEARDSSDGSIKDS